MRTIRLPPREPLTLTSALEVWKENRQNADEEFWQGLFRDHPHLIAAAFPNNVVMIGEKCYVGGKDFSNRGGSLVDFLYMIQSTKTLVAVEIKTPTTGLLGPRYRESVFAMSTELTGAIVQVLHYRDQATKNYYQLCADSRHSFEAINPQCLLVVGNVTAECNEATKRRSLELFRSASNVVILGYDELFAKIENLSSIFSVE